MKAKTGTDIAYAVSLLKEGKLVAIPTDTVYGLAGDATNERAIKDIYSIKNRPSSKALIVQVGDFAGLRKFSIDVNKHVHKLADKFWPGALTLVVKASDSISKHLLAGGETIGFRVPNHPMTLELLKQLGRPLAVPSANISGQPSPTSAAEVAEQLGDQIAYILDGGECSIGMESTIVEFKDDQPVIHRVGAISPEKIKEVLAH